MTGTWPLIRLILRRDRVLMPVWVVIVALLPVAIASGTASIYPTDAGRAGYIRDLAQSSLLTVFYGRTPPPDLGSLVFWRLGTGMLIMGLIGLLTVIRHTRVEEEAGRRELVGAGVVGRYASLAAAVLATTGACLLAGLLVTLGMVSQHTPAVGSLAMGLAWAGAGIVFAGVGAVVAQLSQGAGTARGIGIVVLAASFALRGAGDISADQGGGAAWLSWVPPLGWTYQVQAYQANRWWLLGLVAVLAAGLVWLGGALSARRDIGAGLVQPRLGPATGSPRLRGPFALAWRLQRGTLYAWTAGLAVLGLLIGAAARAAGDLLGDNEQLKADLQRLGGNTVLSDVFLATGLSLAAVFVSAYAIAAALRMRTEEASLRTEALLASPVSRLRWAGSHVVFAVLGPTATMAVCGLAAGVVYGADTGAIGREVPRILGAAVAQLPAIWVLAAVSVALFGLLPRLAAAISWAVLGFCLLLGQVGALLRLGQPVLDVSPFTHAPHLPGGPVPVLPLVVLLVVAAGLAAVGLVAFRRRDVPVDVT